MARKTINRLADSAASIGYQNGWNDAHANYKDRIAELEGFKAEALARLDRLSMALTRIECETPDQWIRNIARCALYGDQAAPRDGTASNDQQTGRARSRRDET